MTDAEKKRMIAGFEDGKADDLPDPWDQDAIREVADKILKKIGERGKNEKM